MFFLLYMPQAKTAEAREAIRAQLQQMLIALQDQLEQAGLLDPEALDDSAMEHVESAEQPAGAASAELDTPELADMRNYLERCFRQSA